MTDGIQIPPPLLMDDFNNLVKTSGSSTCTKETIFPPSFLKDVPS